MRKPILTRWQHATGAFRKYNENYDLDIFYRTPSDQGAGNGNPHLWNRDILVYPEQHHFRAWSYHPTTTSANGVLRDAVFLEEQKWLKNRLRQLDDVEVKFFLVF